MSKIKYNSKEMRKLLRWPKTMKKRYFSERYTPELARSLAEGALLRPGDIIQTCSAFNQVIKTIDPVYYYEKNQCIIDFDIITEDGSGHSWHHCCDKKWTKEEVNDWWFFHANHATDMFGWSETGQAELAWVLDKYKKGESICDDNGFMLSEFKSIRNPRTQKS